jgi:hypothetical protein
MTQNFLTDLSFSSTLLQPMLISIVMAPFGKIASVTTRACVVLGLKIRQGAPRRCSISPPVHPSGKLNRPTYEVNQSGNRVCLWRWTAMQQTFKRDSRQCNGTDRKDHYRSHRKHDWTVVANHNTNFEPSAAKAMIEQMPIEKF